MILVYHLDFSHFLKNHYWSGFACSFGLPCRKLKFIFILLSTSHISEFSTFFNFLNLYQIGYKYWWNSTLPNLLAELYFIFNGRIINIHGRIIYILNLVTFPFGCFIEIIFLFMEDLSENFKKGKAFESHYPAWASGYFFDVTVECHACCSVSSDSFATPWTVACSAPLSMVFPRLEYWSRLPFLTPGDLPDPGIKPTPIVSPALTGRLFTTVPPGEAQLHFLTKFPATWWWLVVG